LETAKEAYLAMRNLKLENEQPKQKNLFFITIPNKVLPGVQLQEDGWFTYGYKYGRKEGENKKFVNFVPFDQKNISAATYERLRIALPYSYQSLILNASN
jgi:hypothetical protein